MNQPREFDRREYEQQQITPTWEGYGLYHESNDSWTALSTDARMARALGATQRVLFVEDKYGDYRGWFDAVMEGSKPVFHVDGRLKIVEVPKMIQHKRVFEVQFPYSSQAGVDRNQGQVVRLSVVRPLPWTPREVSPED